MAYRWMKSAIVPVLCFIFGAGAFLSWAVVARRLLPEHHPLKLARNWDIREEPAGTLFVPLGQEGARVVEITCDPETHAFRSIKFMVEEIGCMFRYDVAGEYGVPEAWYTGGPLEGGITYIDYKADGRLDVLINAAQDRMAILVGRGWVWAVLHDSIAETDEGDFEFNVESGKWEVVNQGSE